MGRSMKSMRLFLALVLLLACGQANAANLSHIKGVAGAGWLHLEDWMFSWPMDQGLPPVDYDYSLVDTQRGSPQGRLFPSDLLRAHAFTEATNYSTITPWYCEGDLVSQTVTAVGVQKTIELFRTHREQYWTDDDLALMSSHGVNTVRLNVGWWAFPTFPLPQTELLVQDMCYANKSFVTLTQPFLEKLLDRFAAHGLQVLIDIHAMPCGSADGTYNGVYPLPPQFFSNAAAASYGFQVVQNMLDWYMGLAAERKKVVHGFTLMNEPGHLIVPQYIPTADPIVRWLQQAVALYEQQVVMKMTDPPLLYMNMIDTAYGVFPQTCVKQKIDPNDKLQCMAHVLAKDCGLANKSWAVFDVHHYFSWDNGNGIDNCATDQNLTGYVDDGMYGFTGEIIKTGAEAGLMNYATSEWSLCTHRNDTQDCAAADELSIMYEQQTDAYTLGGFANFFWGWKMPYGGWHEAKWSLKNYMTGKH